ncbi:4Fe-4S cluster-binding domain-containing protein, partial [Listeria monocytogenes]|uniref:4Fe-4S cluster-binding domain-containing protein n=1 Tax=Listeria monocytogenes TaxID=1639 RepID=UPI00122D6DB7
MNNTKPCGRKSNELSRGNIVDYKAFNLAAREGDRRSLYVSGCPFHCERCHNKAAQSLKYYKTYTKELEDDILKDNGHVTDKDLTLL